MSKVTFPIWEQPTSNGWFIWGTKLGTKVHPQFRTMLKGHPNARAPHKFVEVFIELYHHSTSPSAQTCFFHTFTRMGFESTP